VQNTGEAAETTLSVPTGHGGSLWLRDGAKRPVPVNGRPDYATPVEGFDGWLGLMPLPAGSAPLLLPGAVRLLQPDAPLQWRRGAEPTNDAERAAAALADRASHVWDRIQDMEVSLADPAELWTRLRDRWMSDEDRPPHMHLIVKQARALARVIDELERTLRRILRRTHRRIPVSRVQEMDRRSMIWAARQPGETLAERAGDAQRLLAVVREENFDTLENRVLRAYAELAAAHARDYGRRNASRKPSERARKVAEFGRRCRNLARDLVALGVRKADADATPNFVLLEDDRYRRIWRAWGELRRNALVEDELWRWQARSWEEFCALAVVVALISRPGTRLLAAAPVRFREEQERGAWVDAANPLVTIYMPDLGVVAEVQYRAKFQSSTDWRRTMAAPLWLKFQSITQADKSESLVAIWPLWDKTAGLPQGEAGEVDAAIAACKRQMGGTASLSRGIVLRPADCSAHQESGRASVIGLGVVGSGLRDGLADLSSALERTIMSDAAP